MEEKINELKCEIKHLRNQRDIEDDKEVRKAMSQELNKLKANLRYWIIKYNADKSEEGREIAEKYVQMNTQSTRKYREKKYTEDKRAYRDYMRDRQREHRERQKETAEASHTF